MNPGETHVACRESLLNSTVECVCVGDDTCTVEWRVDALQRAEIRTRAARCERYPRAAMLRARLEAGLERLGRSAPGARLLELAVRAWPALRPAHRALMRAHSQRGDWPRALEHARAALRARPGDRRALALSARALQRLARPDEAAQAWEELLRRDPGRVEAWEPLGQCYALLGRHAEARGCFERALPHTRHRARSLHRLARACMGMGDTDRHRALCLELRALLASSATISDYERWAQVEEELGEDGSPVGPLRAALRALPPGDPRAAGLLRRLAARVPLTDETLALAEALAAAGDAEMAWVARASRALAEGRNADAAAELRRLPPERRERATWSGLMRVADPGHFACDAPLPAPHAGVGRRGDLAAVCCFFDPSGSRARLRNFEIFHRHLLAAGVPLLVVELAFGDQPFRLGGVDDLLQLRGGDVMWQKERLLNLGIARLLAQGWRKIAWLDADVVFESPDWAERASRALDAAALCQPFTHAHLRWYRRDPGAYMRGAAYHDASAPGPARDFHHTGFAWAARAELLAEAPLYDAGILGSGDVMIYAASHAEPRPPGPASLYQAIATQLPPAMREHYDRWARAFGERVGGRVAFADGCLQTLYHGPLLQRRYAARSAILRRHGFSPAADLALDAAGLWRWASDKPELRCEVAEYFASRADDEGAPAAASAPAAGDAIDERRADG